MTGATTRGHVTPFLGAPPHPAATHDLGPIVWFDGALPVIASVEIAATWQVRP